MLGGLWAEGLWTGGEFALSQRGDLLYPAGTVQGTANRLAIVTPDGDVSRDWSDDRLPLNDVAVSPDGRRIAVQVDNVGQGEALLQIRVSDFARPALATVGTRPGKDCNRPRWSPDSRSLAFDCTDQNGAELYAAPVERAASADPILRVPAGARISSMGFTADSTHAIARCLEADGTSRLLVVPVATPVASMAEAREIPMETRDWSDAWMSPDGQWLAYVAKESGVRSLYARPVSRSGSVAPPRVLVAQDAIRPRWGKTVRDGRYDLWFVKEGRVHSVELTTRPEPRVTSPVAHGLTPARIGEQAADTLPDGNFLVIVAPDTVRGAAELRLVLNWTRELAALD